MEIKINKMKIVEHEAVIDCSIIEGDNELSTVKKINADFIIERLKNELFREMN